MEVEHLQADTEEDVEKRNVYTYNRRKAECSTLQQASLPNVRRAHESCLLEDSDGQFLWVCKQVYYADKTQNNKCSERAAKASKGFGFRHIHKV